jgi:hypothetical protein
MEIVIVERTLPEPMPYERLVALEEAAAWCLEVRNITFLRSYFSLDQRRMICVYEAPDAESVRDANAEAKMPFDRVWSATRHIGEAERRKNAPT